MYDKRLAELKQQLTEAQRQAQVWQDKLFIIRGAINECTWHQEQAIKKMREDVKPKKTKKK